MKLQKYKFCLSLFLLNMILLFIKQFIIYRLYKYLSPFEHCIEYLISDLYFLIIIAFFCTINYNTNNKAINVTTNIIILFLILLFYIDIFTIYYFQTHETIISIISITKFWWNWFTGIWIFWSIAFIITLWLCTILSKLKWIQKYALKCFSTTTFTICLITWLIIYFIQSFIFNVPIPYTRNIVSINIQAISNMTEKDILTDAKYEDYIKFERWDWKDVNIILIFAESLSAIDSANLWWEDNMPYLDQIQKNWITFTNFISNGTESCQAHVSTLIGIIPKKDYTYNYYFGEWLADFLNKQWYNTTFISATPLSFANQIDFIKRIWFQTIIWEEAFESEQKYTFDSVPDGKLYERILQEIQNQTWKYFIGWQTISFHTPYDTPLWKTEKLALQYSDEELYKFYQWLQDLWFFDNWILFIIWDHRKRSPAKSWEVYTFWDMRNYRSVATVVGTWIQPYTTNTNIIQHSDFYYSIKKLVWRWYIAMDTFYNNIFQETASRTRWITSNSFTILKWNKYYEVYIDDIKKNYKDIFRYYAAQKKRFYNKVISQPLN